MNSKDLGGNDALLKTTKSNTVVAYGRNYVSDLTNSNDTATNGVDGRISNNTWCKCESCAPMETSIGGVCCLEKRETCRPRVSDRSCSYVCRLGPHFVL